MTDSPDIVYLVHGSNAHTWWRRFANKGYPWWRRWSLFACGVREGLKRECEVREFRWSGRNSHQARLDAGADLARAIEEDDPERRIHLVGHSHGGNVVLAALNRLSQRTVESAVILANPHMALLDSRGSSPEWLYWGKGAPRAARIWNLYSPQDFVQGKLAEWFHGVPKDGRKVLHVRRQYGGLEHKSVQNAEISWRRRLAAHPSMHSAAIGLCVGALLRGATLPEAIKAAGLTAEGVNDAYDRGGWPGATRTFEMVRQRADPGAFDLGNTSSRVGVLFVHGFTASPAEMRPMAQFVAEQKDWRCKAVVLPGHGTRVEDMRESGSREWMAAVESEYDALAGDCDHVLLVGLSLGAVLCCHLALHRRQDSKLRGLILVAPAFAVTRTRSAGIHFLRAFGYVGTKSRRASDYFLDNRLYTYLHLPMKLAAELLKLGATAAKRMGELHELPVQMFAGDRESTVSLKTILAVARDHPFIRLVRLPRSRHILTVEPDKQILFESSLRFMEECLGRGMRGG